MEVISDGRNGDLNDSGLLQIRHLSAPNGTRPPGRWTRRAVEGPGQPAPWSAIVAIHRSSQPSSLRCRGFGGWVDDRRPDLWGASVTVWRCWSGRAGGSTTTGG